MSPMKCSLSSGKWGAVIAAASLMMSLPLASFAGTPAATPEPSPEQVQQEYARIKKENKEKDQVQKEQYLRSRPHPGGLLDESDIIKMHSARLWHLLTYPTGTLPSMPWTKAKNHNRNHVPDALPWPGDPLNPAVGGASSDEMESIFSEAVIAPQTNTWVSYGPRPLDSVGTTNNAYRYGLVAGRVSAGGLAVHPTDPTIAYAGFTAGGLWKTTNLGSATVTWTPLWDDKDFVTQAAGAIEFDPNNSNVLYVGTGDWAANDQFSEGIMKTTDGGATWTHLGATVFTPYSPTHPVGGNRWGSQNIRAIKVDPKSSSRLVAGTRFDFYISHDAGVTWQICPFGANYSDPSASATAINAINRISSIYLDARGTTTVGYVAVGYPSTANNGNNGIYRFTMPAAGCPAAFTPLNAGLPAGTGNGVNGGADIGRIELAAGTGTDGGLTLYAQVAKGSNYSLDGTYVLRPDGGATTWTKLSGSTTLPTCSSATGGDSGQDWYDLYIAVNPTNDKDVYIGHIDTYRATVSSTYTSMTQTNLTNVYATSCPSYGKVHPDQHTLAFVPGTNGTTFLLGNDGGIYYNNAGGNVNNWKQLNDTINTTQFYAGQIGKDFAGGGQQWWLGGMQDNGNGSWDSSKANLTSTGRSVGGDGFFTAFDVLAGTETSGWWFTEYTYGSMYCSRNGGADGPFVSSCGPVMSGSADWSAPFQMDTLHCTNSVCRNMIFGEDYIHVAGAFGTQKPTWKRVSPLLSRSTSGGSILAVSFAPSEPKSAVAGTSDGKVWWSETIFTGSGCTQAAANTSSFSCSPNTRSAVWRDVDSTNAVLPNRAILGVAADPANHRTIYAAVGGFDDNTPTTPGHVFQFTWNGSSWTRANKTGNLPDVPASGIAVNPHNRKQVFVGTYFGFYYTDDIDAAVPVWTRYQHGLPNTVIAYLTIDRGPASNPALGTTLMAFTYGRGVYAIKLPTTGTFPIH